LFPNPNREKHHHAPRPTPHASPWAQNILFNPRRAKSALKKKGKVKFDVTNRDKDEETQR